MACGTGMAACFYRALHEGLVKEKNFLDYTIFVTFFPQLIAGPIVHHKEMMPQFASKWNLVKNYKNIALGLFIFSIGLFKKVVIADTFAVWATAGFDTATTLNLFEAWATSLSHTFQLYFDFPLIFELQKHSNHEHFRKYLRSN